MNHNELVVTMTNMLCICEKSSVRKTMPFLITSSSLNDLLGQKSYGVIVFTLVVKGNKT